MFTIIMFGLAVFVILVHIALTKKKRNAKSILEIILLDYFILSMGIGTIIAGLAHIFNGPEIAKGIGWAVGSPFQTEVGLANLGVGIASLISFAFRGTYWLAIAIVWAVFAVGAGMVHVLEMFGGNTAVYNSGFGILFTDFVAPILVLILVVAYLRISKK
jgi:hypothetical protein